MIISEIRDWIESTIRLVGYDIQEAKNLVDVTVKELPKKESEQLLYEWEENMKEREICPRCLYDLDTAHSQGELIEYQGTSFRAEESYSKCSNCGWNELHS